MSGNASMQPEAGKTPRSTAFARLADFAAARDGATAIEYGLLVAGLALFILTAVALAGSNISGVMNKIAAALH